MGFQAAFMAFNVFKGVSEQKAANRAAAKAQDAANFNADIIERDIGLFSRQRDIINANFSINAERSARAFEREVQGAVRAGYGYGGIDMSQGTPIQVLRENAREFDYEQSVKQFDNLVTNQQIDDAIEDTELSAALSRMEGGAQAAGLRAQGTRSLLNSIGESARFGYETGVFE
jgi:hypothetical protein